METKQFIKSPGNLECQTDKIGGSKRKLHIQKHSQTIPKTILVRPHCYQWMPQPQLLAYVAQKTKRQCHGHCHYHQSRYSLSLPLSVPIQHPRHLVSQPWSEARTLAARDAKKSSVSIFFFICNTRQVLPPTKTQMIDISLDIGKRFKCQGDTPPNDTNPCNYPLPPIRDNKLMVAVCIQLKQKFNEKTS